MDLFQQLDIIYKQNFFDGETDLGALMVICSLYYITEDGTIYYDETIKNFTPNKVIASICLVKDNHICLIATLDKFKSKGYAYNMLKVICERIPKLNLYVRYSNSNAQNLYLKCGFVKKNEVMNFYHYYRNGIEYLESGIFMERE